MKSICGADCPKCPMNMKCAGCEATGGCPFGKQCFIAKVITIGGEEAYDELRKELVREINALNVPGLPELESLMPLLCSYVNLEYPLPNGSKMKLLDDKSVYLGIQVPCAFDDSEEHLFGVVADMSQILVAEYGLEGTNPELVIYKRR